jgi:hypothetical protein
MKKIIFSSDDGVSLNLKNYPSPAIKNIPQWYKTLSKYVYKDQKNLLLPDGGINLTVKSCTPFFDSLSLGYIYNLSTDILVVSPDEYDGKRIVWQVEENIIDIHSPLQAQGIYDKDIYEEVPYKFMSKWSIKTPPGYSILITHPLNRTDLPFLTLSGVVDTDEYDGIINFPFILKKNFYGKIEKNTPIAQIIPFKRDDWSSDYSIFLNKKTSFYQLKSVLVDSYKKQWWKRKKFN